MSFKVEIAARSQALKGTAPKGLAPAQVFFKVRLRAPQPLRLVDRIERREAPRSCETNRENLIRVGGCRYRRLPP